jgi:hypothetical protein
MLKKSANFVLASLRGSTYRTEYASPLLSLRPRWTTFLNILWPVQTPFMILCQHVYQGCPKGFSTAARFVLSLTDQCVSADIHRSCVRHRLRLNHWGPEDCRRLLKRDAMFFKVRNRLRDIPRKHIHVYTLTRPPVARTEDAADLFGLSGLWGRG